MPSPQDLIHVVSTTTGTGDMTVTAVIRNFSDSDAFGTGTTADVFDYFGWNDDVPGEWERGTGHMSATNTLVRDTVKASSNGGAAVNWSAGTKHFTNDVPAAKQAIPNKIVISPFQFGGTGDGVADDASALNAAFDAIRTQLATDAKNLSRVVLDLSGGIWRTTGSINATSIVGWNWQVRGGVIVGECTGKAVLDLCGSRGYELHGVAVWGDKTNMPACGWQAARTTAVGFCDNASFFDCATAGYFSRAAIHEYGQETALHVHGTYFNYHHDARVAIFEGYDENGLASDFATVVTGAVSHINNKLLNCDFRYLPSDANVAVITGVSNATSGVITTSGHSFVVGDQVVFADVGGMTNMRYQIANVTAVSGNSFTTDVNTTSFGTYTSGGIAAKRQTKASVYYSRGAGMNFADSYIVSYGQPQLEIGFPDATFLSYSELDLDILFEGAACASNVLFTTSNQNVSLQGCRLKTYQADPTNALMDIDSGTGTLSLYAPAIECVSTKHTIPLIPTADRARFACIGAKVLWAGIANVDYANYALFTGVITDIAAGLDTYIGPKFADKRDGSWTPTVTSLTGTITTVGTKTCKVSYLGKWAYVSIDVTITTNGTGAGQVQVSLPFTIGDSAVIPGKEQAVTGKMLAGICLSGLTSCAVLNYDNTYPAANGTRLVLSGWIPVA